MVESRVSRGTRLQSSKLVSHPCSGNRRRRQKGPVTIVSSAFCCPRAFEMSLLPTSIPGRPAPIPCGPQHSLLPVSGSCVIGG
jgi:hypothetical protein